MTGTRETGVEQRCGLAKCSLCENTEDPRFGANVGARRFPLCDGCGGPETEREAADLIGRLRALPPAPASASAPCEHPMDRRRGELSSIWCAVCGSCWYSDNPADKYSEARWHASDVGRGRASPTENVHRMRLDEAYAEMGKAPTTECEACAGTGRYGLRDDDDCPACHGSGQRSEKVELAGCGKCTSTRHEDGRSSVRHIDPNCATHAPRLRTEGPCPKDGDES